MGNKTHRSTRDAAYIYTAAQVRVTRMVHAIATDAQRHRRKDTCDLTIVRFWQGPVNCGRGDDDDSSQTCWGHYPECMLVSASSRLSPVLEQVRCWPTGVDGRRSIVRGEV
ncbi:hypothetical protein M8818_007448 [Zalaria obscura]|uniref:Uncharacterized protein n=1 Tax=Zalaria obscura TaxID=2024903 RepID=A0ACC3S517_9PEZI